MQRQDKFCFYVTKFWILDYVNYWKSGIIILVSN